MDKFSDIMKVENGIDVVDRIGGPIEALSVEDGLAPLMDNDSNNCDHLEDQKRKGTEGFAC